MTLILIGKNNIYVHNPKKETKPKKKVNKKPSKKAG